MKFSKFYFVLLFLLISCEPSTTTTQFEPPSEELTITTAAHQFISSQISLLSQQYNMTCGGIGTSLYDGVKKLTWYFDIPKKLTKEEGRVIVMDCVSQIVKNANNDSELKTFFNKDGFSEQNVNLIIVVNLGKQEVYYPDIKVIGFRDKEFGFHTDDREKIVKTFYTSEYESYDDAVAILKAQGREDVLLEAELTSVNHEVQ